MDNEDIGDLELYDKKKSQLVDIITKLNRKIKDMEEKHDMEINELNNELSKTAKIKKYYESKTRSNRRKDLDTDQIVEMYKSGCSAYSVAKQLGAGEMTIILRLKKAGVYEGKKHNK